MRYKFRGKRVDNGKWVEGYLIQSIAIGKAWIKDTNDKYTNPRVLADDYADFRCVEVIPESIGQYVGLNDSKRTKEYPEGQEIYEGDFIKDAQGSIYIVYWDKGECAFKLDYKYYHHRDKDECHTYLPMYSRKGEVIGNIHDKEDTP
ncbi:MAG: YopX family protein [Bacteroidales bacterium]